VAGPATKLKTRSWAWVRGGGWVWSWVAHLIDVGLKKVGRGEERRKWVVRFWKKGCLSISDDCGR